jgi:hypothetical protein
MIKLHTILILYGLSNKYRIKFAKSNAPMMDMNRTKRFQKPVLAILPTRKIKLRLRSRPKVLKVKLFTKRFIKNQNGEYVFSRFKF